MVKPNTHSKHADGDGASPHAADPSVRSLTELKRDLGAADPALRAEELDAVPRDALLLLGKRAASSDILAAVPTFVAEAARTWSGLTEPARKKVVGFTPRYLALLVDEALELDAKYQTFVDQDAKTTADLTRRRRALRDAVTEGVSLRDQCARALRRRVRGDSSALESIESATGTAEEPKRLVAGLETLATTLESHRAAATKERRAHLDEIGLDAAYVEQLRAAAKAVAAAQSAATVGVSGSVSQDDLDAQDGRVMHLVDCVYRAFKDAAPRVPGLAPPSLGALETSVAPKSRAGRSEDQAGGGTPAQPAAGGGGTGTENTPPR